MSPDPWEIKATKSVVSTRIFEVTEDTAVAPHSGETCHLTRLLAPDWVNMIVLTAERDIVLVRQWRHGVRSLTLEIPGGMVDPGEEPVVAAVREVREETGFAGDAPQALGVVRPNPAFLSNHCHTFLLENCRAVGPLKLDPGEDIEVVSQPLAAIPDLIARGEITNSLVVCAFWWLKAARPDLI